MWSFRSVAALYRKLGRGRVEGEEVLLMGSVSLGGSVEPLRRM